MHQVGFTVPEVLRDFYRPDLFTRQKSLVDGDLPKFLLGFPL